MRLTSPQLQKLRNLKNIFVSLGDCKELYEVIDRLSNIHDGLSAFVVDDYEAAIEHFEKLPPDRALTQQLLGTTYYRKSLQYGPGSIEYKRLRREADGHSDQFRLLADQEIGGLVKQTVIQRYVCNVESRRTLDRQTSQQALNCLNRLVSDGIADHNTYYNMADIQSRLGEFDDSLQDLRKAAEKDTRHEITQSYIADDPDLKNLSVNPRYHREWLLVVSLFRG